MKLDVLSKVIVILVRARKSPWIETFSVSLFIFCLPVRARKSPWIETDAAKEKDGKTWSGLVRARGLKPIFFTN